MEEFDTTPSNDDENGDKHVSAEKITSPAALSESEEDMNRPTVLEDDDSHPIPLSMDAAILDDEVEQHQEEKRKSDLQLVPSEDDAPLPLHHLEETTSSNNDNSDVATMKRQIMESRGATTRSNNTTTAAAPSSIQGGRASEGSSRLSSSRRITQFLQSNSTPTTQHHIDSGSHSSIPILEATLVEEQRPEPVYDAVAIIEGENSDDDNDHNTARPWLRKHHFGIFIALVVIIVILIVLVVVLIGDDSKILSSVPEVPQNISADSAADIVNNSTLSSQFSTSTTITPTNTPTTTPKLCARLAKTIPFYYARVAIDGNTAVITNNPGQQHEVHFFTLTNEGLFEPEAYFNTDHSVFDVAISGNTTVVGDPVSNNYVGSVLVYERNVTTGKWFQSTRFESEDNDIPELRFGYRVDIDNGTLAVGANNDGVGIGPGYVYRKNDDTFEWMNEGIINHGDNTQSISLLGDTLAVSTYLNGGTVSVFKFDMQSKKWKKLSRDLTNTGDCPGWLGGGSIAVTDNGSLIVGCGRRSSLTHNGIIYYYVQTDITGEYHLQQRTEIKEVNGTHVLGDMIAVDGDTMVVGGDYDNDVIILRNQIDDTWTEATSIPAPKGVNRNSFGWQVAISGNKILISSVEAVFFYMLENC